jgi:hypothetical protein
MDESDSISSKFHPENPPYVTIHIHPLLKTPPKGMVYTGNPSNAGHALFPDAMKESVC